ncbi:short subunit fatty acids transporter [Caldalkalibacillus uzonensis]|uniref:Short subunit fatty acids transporter n=1 Tax=Caldalkalibacillus uzonensis TaxID=353224 RepID=A0ABU0CXM7_9BACI|nr:short subunit fatty acids transporter [Caldalkalibacillus uzonensis]
MIPTSHTIFAGFNLFIVIALLVVLPVLNRMMLTSTENRVYIDRTLLEEPAESATQDQYVARTPAEKLENSRLVSLLTGAMGLAFILYYFIVQSGTWAFSFMAHRGGFWKV